MNNDLISRSALLELVAERNRSTCNGSMSCIQMRRMVESIPAVEAVPVRRGRWKEHFNEGYEMWYYDCPFCNDGYAMKERDRNPPNYCNNCGAYLAKEAVK